jgi:hypothetical protein
MDRAAALQGVGALVVIGFTAGIWSAAGSPAWLRGYATAVIVAILVFALWEHWLWRLPLMQRLPRVPRRIDGTWAGTLTSLWTDPATERRPDEKRVFLVVRQTASRVTLELLTEESTSRSSIARLSRDEMGLSLAYMYSNRPDSRIEHRSTMHNGSAFVEISGTPAMRMRGRYWTDRYTRGELDLQRRTTRAVVDFREAAELAVTKHAAEGRMTSFRRRLPGVLSIAMLALLGSGVACTAKHDAKLPPPAAAPDSAPAEEPTPVAPAPMAVAPIEVVRPRCDQFTLTENGVGAVEIGDPRDSIRTRCIVVSDSTTQNGEGAVQGNVVVGVAGSPLVVEIADGRVYRLAVTDTVFRTHDGLGPGFAVARLLDLPGAIVLEGVHDLSVVVNAHCGLYFRIPKPATVPENGGRWTDVVRAMPEGTSVERVVVHGCRTPAAS